MWLSHQLMMLLRHTNQAQTHGEGPVSGVDAGTLDRLTQPLD